MNREDYIYCEDCKTFVDLYKYDHRVEDAGHQDCTWRFVTEDELRVCIAECEKEGCFRD